MSTENELIPAAPETTDAPMTHQPQELKNQGLFLSLKPSQRAIIQNEMNAICGELISFSFQQANLEDQLRRHAYLAGVKDAYATILNYDSLVIQKMEQDRSEPNE